MTAARFRRGWVDGVINPRTDAGIELPAAVGPAVAALRFRPAHRTGPLKLRLGSLLIVFGRFAVRAFR